ncbi:MAG: hypothetical protein Q9192_006672, partial [Flavoplaca navasiana]
YKQTQTDNLIDGTAAGDLTACLNELVSKLSSDQQREVRNQLDQHAAFLDGLAQQSKVRMNGTIRASLAADRSESSDVEGSPGMFLLKWQRFIDQTPITPGPNNGPPRTGKSESVVDATAVDVDGEKPPVIYQQSTKTDALSLEPPDVSAVVRLLEPGFEKELQRIVASRERKGYYMATLEQLLTSEPRQKEADWAAIRMTLSQLKDLLGDRGFLNQKYGFTYSESIPRNDGTANEANDKTPAHTYYRLSLLFGFESSADFLSLQCNIMEEAGIQPIVSDVPQSTGRLYSAFENDINEQEALLRAQRRKLEEVMLLSSSYISSWKALLDRVSSKANVGNLKLPHHGGGLEHGADPNAMTSWLPQLVAAERGQAQVLRLLLSQEGVDVSALDSLGRTAPHHAATSVSLETVHLLLQQDGIAVDITDKDDSTQLFAAVAKRFFPPTSLSQTPKGLIACDNLKPTLHWLRKTSSVGCWLYRKSMSIVNANEPAVRLLLEKGADVNSRVLNKKFKDLYQAFRFWPSGFSGEGLLWDFALRHGKARIDTEDCEVSAELIGAAAEGHASVVRILLAHGASGSALDVRGRTALCYAAAGGCTDIVAMLLHAGAGVSNRDDSGNTPSVLAVVKLYLDAGNRHPENGYLDYSNVIKKLLDHDADPQDVMDIRHPPTSRPLWDEAAGNFGNLLKAYNGYLDCTITQHPFGECL